MCHPEGYAEWQAEQAWNAEQEWLASESARGEYEAQLRTEEEAEAGRMTAEQIERDLRILEVQWHHGMPYVEYERKKRQLENKLEKIKKGGE